MGRSDLFSKESSAYKAAAKLRNPVAHAARLEWKSRARMARPLLVDVAMLVLAGAATQVASHLAGYPKPPITWIVIFGVLVLVMFGARGMYSQRLRSHLLDEIRQVVSATAVATMAVISFAHHHRRRPAHVRPDRPGLDPGHAVPLGRPHGPLHLPGTGDRPRRGPPRR